MRIARFFIILTVVSIGLNSCSTTKTVNLVSVDSFEIVARSNTGIEAEVEVTLENQFSGKVKIKSGELFVKSTVDNRTLAKATLSQQLVIAGKSQKSYIVPVRIRFGMGSITRLMKEVGQGEEFLMSGVVVAKKGLIRKKIDIEEIVDAQSMQIISDEVGEE